MGRDGLGSLVATALWSGKPIGRRQEPSRAFGRTSATEIPTKVRQRAGLRQGGPKNNAGLCGVALFASVAKIPLVAVLHGHALAFITSMATLAKASPRIAQQPTVAALGRLPAPSRIPTEAGRSESGR